MTLDRHAVCVQRGSVTVGHVPREVAIVFKGFISHGGEITCEVTGRRNRETDWRFLVRTILAESRI